MGDGAKASDGTAAQLSSVEGLSAVWDAFRAGGVMYCPRESAPLALAVDAAAASYRFVCVRCGKASPWFESGPSGLRLRGPTPTLNPGSALSED